MGHLPWRAVPGVQVSNPSQVIQDSGELSSSFSSRGSFSPACRRLLRKQAPLRRVVRAWVIIVKNGCAQGVLCPSTSIFASFFIQSIFAEMQRTQR